MNPLRFLPPLVISCLLCGAAAGCGVDVDPGDPWEADEENAERSSPDDGGFLCDPRAPDVPCCSDELHATMSGDVGLTSGPSFPWTAGYATSTPDYFREAAEADLPIAGPFAGYADAGPTIECDEYFDNRLDCAGATSFAVWTPTAPFWVRVPVRHDDIDLERDEEVTVSFSDALGLTVRDARGELVLHVSGAPEFSQTFEERYGELVVRVADETDFSAATCILGPDFPCGRTFRMDRLLLMGDETIELGTGVTEIQAGSHRYRVSHLQSSVRVPSLAGEECADVTPLQPAYAIVRLQQ